MLIAIWNSINSYIWEIIGIILTTVASYIGLKFKNIYETKIKTKTKQEVVKNAVDMVEQIASRYNYSSEEKLNKAKTTAIELLKNIGIEVTDLELEVLIESVCRNFCKSLSS